MMIKYPCPASSGEGKKAKLRVKLKKKKPLTSLVLLPYKHRLPAASGSGTTFGFIRKHCIILRVKKNSPNSSSKDVWSCIGRNPKAVRNCFLETRSPIVHLWRERKTSYFFQSIRHEYHHVAAAKNKIKTRAGKYACARSY